MSDSLLREAIREIRAVACGEKQVADDDTEGMRWIFRRCEEALSRTAASYDIIPRRLSHLENENAARCRQIENLEESLADLRKALAGGDMARR